MKARVQLEAETVLQEAELVDQSKVKSYVEDLKCLLEEADLIQSKAFLRSFIKRIEISANQVRIEYRLPLPAKNDSKGVTEVLPIVPLGGPFGTVPELLFEKKQLIPALQQLILSCLHSPLLQNIKSVIH